MKGFILLSALALVHGGTIETHENGCPKDDAIEKLLPHDDCWQFYQCINGELITRNCPAGLYFDSERKVCDWPRKTDCWKQQDNTDPENTEELDASDPSQASKICAAPKSNDVLVAHAVCNKFYKCFHGSPVALNCPLKLLYNPDTEQCDWPEKVDCGSRVISNETEDSGNDNYGNGGNETVEVDIDSNENITINDDPSEAPTICNAEGSESVLVAHENCNQFYICSQGLPVALECPLNLLYNPSKEYCDWPVNVDCGSRIIPENEDTNDDVEENELKRRIREVESNINSDPSKAPAICAAEGSNGVLVAHENCNQFYKCSGGHPVALSCPLNLLYNPSKEYCDWPQEVDCGNRVIPDPEDDSAVGGGNGPESEGDDEDKVPDQINDDPSKAPEICAADGSDGVLVAHENCNQFYKCSEGVPVALSCPLNLLYNPSKKYCDWPQNVDCGNRVIPEPEDDSVVGGGNGPESEGDDEDKVPDQINDDPSQAPEICAADGSDGVLVAHENCNQFYKCSEGLPVALSCPLNLLYNPSKKYCDWPQNVDCGNRVIPDPEDDSAVGGGNGPESEGDDEDKVPDQINDDPSQAPEICATDGSDGVLVAHENCNQFYKCFEGLPVAMSCPLNLLFNPSKEYCDWPQNVDCGDRVIPEPEDDSAADGGNGLDSGGDDEDKVPEQEINDDPSKAPAICNADGSESVLVAHENCNQFYICSQGLTVALECPLNLLYNPSKKYCDWPVNVDCGSRIIPENEDTNDVKENKLKRHIREVESNVNSDPSEAPAICAAEGSDGVLVAHENCNQFYKCSEGLPVALSCPLNLLYNPSKKYCDWPHNVDCGNRVIPEPEDDSAVGGGNGPESGGADEDKVPDQINDDPSQAPEICAADGSDGVLVAHENCNQFYKCYEGLPVALSCPLNLLYNPSKKYCDWPQNVDCGNRVIPEPEDDSAVDGGNGQGNGGDDEDKVPDQEINDDPSKAPEICTAAGSDGVLVAHELCNQFYKCSEGLPVALICPGNLLYNPSMKYCDWPQNVECGDRSVLQEDNVDKNEEKEIDEDKEVDYGVQAAAVCADASSNALLVPHGNCNQFYKCAFGSPVAISCPSGLLYNPRLEVCDWPTNVECGSRNRKLQTEKRFLEAKKALRFLLRVY